MDYQQKMAIIKEAEALGVTITCEKYKISRTLYYRWYHQYKKQGVQGLKPNTKPRTPINKTSPEITLKVLELITNYPTYGPKAIYYLTDELSLGISESAVYNIMKRHDLTTKDKRLKFAYGKYLDKQNRKLQNSHQQDSMTTQNEMDTTLKSGSHWHIWITDFGKLSDAGTIYQYVIMDYVSQIACSRLYTATRSENLDDLLNAVAIPVALALHFDVQTVTIDYESELWGKSKKKIKGEVESIFQHWGLTPKVEIEPSEISDTRGNYTEKSLHHLKGLIQNKKPIEAIKLGFQRWVRHYNINELISYETGDFAPIEYHRKEMGEKIFLPLWTYLDKPY